MRVAISRIILFVDDVPKMTEFYVGTLGLSVIDGGSPDFVSLDAGGCQLSLHELPTRYKNASGTYKPREDSYTKIVFHSDDVESERTALIESGVKIREMHRYEGIEFCDGFDPEGNVFQISSRSHRTICEQ